MGAAGAELRRIAREARSLPRQLVESAGTDVVRVIDAQLSRDSGGDRVLSGTNRQGGGRPLRVVKKITGKADVVTLSVKAGPQGKTVAVWHWLEYGTSPHGGHPGTPAKHTWSRSADPALDGVVRDANQRFNSIL